MLYKGFLLFLVVLLFGCVVPENPNDGLAPGIWRAELELFPSPLSVKPEDPRNRDATIERRTDATEERLLPFLFEVSVEKDSSYTLTLLNGEERIPLKDIRFGYDRSQSKDTLFVDMPVYNSYIRALVEGPFMTGDWIDKNRESYRIPFRATYGKNHLFSTLKKTPLTDMSGRWAVTFSPGTEDAYPAIGEFEQEGNKLTGTFLTETGDYRYLSGTIQANKLYLSAFDGAHAFLFQGKLTDENNIVGSFRSGKHFRTTWQASRKPDVQLRSADSLTYLKDGYDYLAFHFPQPNGDTLAFDSRQSTGQLTLIQILGTWCPNCRDEVNWLKTLLEDPKYKDIQVKGLAFEKTKSNALALERIATYQKKMDVPYPIAYAGSSNKKEAARALPQLNHIMSYPTLIVVDKKGQIRKIHTGFAGPATSAYKQFDDEMRAFLLELQSEEG